MSVATGRHQRVAPWSPVASGFLLLWAVRAEQRYARRFSAEDREQITRQAA
jgi:hypothetical protein